jgi:tetratricopeptide (TPR) repeat protein
MPSYQPHKHWIKYPTSSGDAFYPFALWREKSNLLRLIGNWQASEDILQTNLEKALAAEDERTIAQAKTDLSSMFDTRGKMEQAYVLAQEAIQHWERLNDQPGLIRAIRAKGSIHLHRSEYAKALECFSACLDLSRQAGRDNDICQILSLMGLVHFETGDLPVALRYYSDSLELSQRANEPQYLAMAAGNTGNVYLEMNRLDEAMECYQRALTESRRAGDKQAIAFGIGNIAIIHQKKGEYRKATEWTMKQYQSFLELGDEVHLATSLLNLGQICLDTGELDQAVDSFTRQIAISEKLQDKPILSYGYYMLGIVQEEKGWPGPAQKAMEQAVEVGRSIDFEKYLCGYLSRLAKFHLEQGRPELAQAMIPEAKEIAVRVNRLDVAFDLDVLSARLQAEGNKEAAIEQLKTLAPSAPDDDQKAAVLLQIYRLAGGEAYRRQAAELFRKLCDKTPSYLYRKTLAELT